MLSRSTGGGEMGKNITYRVKPADTVSDGQYLSLMAEGI